MTDNIFSSHWGLFSVAICFRSSLIFHRDRYREARRMARKFGKYNSDNFSENFALIDHWNAIANEHATAFRAVRMLAENFRDNLSQEAIEAIRNLFAVSDDYEKNTRKVG